MISDLRQALRLLRRDPLFAGAAILALALGLAANTAIFSLVHGILLRPLSFPDSGRLISVQERIPSLASRYPQIPVNARAWQAWRMHARTLSGIALLHSTTLTLTGAGEPMALNADAVTANYLSVLGVHPLLGRGFSANADQAGSRREVVLSNSLWRARFHSRASILGRGILLDGDMYVVMGVLPPRFPFFLHHELSPIIGLGSAPRLLTPVRLSQKNLQADGNFNYCAVARLRPGVALARGASELNRIVSGQTSANIPQLRAVVVPLRAMVTAGARGSLWLLQAAVLAVLLIICVNLANLLLARATAREQEASIRAALGASRGRLLRLALSEALLLAFLGGLLGLALAGLSLHALLAAAPASLPRRHGVGLDFTVLAFTFLVSLAAGLIAGLLPAWRLSRSQPRNALYAAGQRVGVSRGRMRASAVLLGAESALCIALLLLGGLLLAGFARRLRQPTGFAVRQVREARLNLTRHAYAKPAQRRQFWRGLLRTLRRLPGVQSAALINTPPLGGNNNVNPISIPGDTRPLIEQPLANYRNVSPGLFRLLHIPLVAGRRFTAADRGQPVAIVSAAAARAAWPGRNPLGQIFYRSPGGQHPLRVVGVVADMRGIGLFDPPGLMVYRPWGAPLGATLLLRSRLPSGALAAPLRRAVWRLDAALPVGRVRAMRRAIAATLAPRRFQLWLVAIFAGAALLLVAFGIYAVVSYATLRRTREIGIRVALGARPPDIYRLIVVQALYPALIGMAAGLAAALAAGRWLASRVFAIRGYDPLVLCAVILLLVAAALLASSLPARRALRLRPVAALRAE